MLQVERKFKNIFFKRNDLTWNEHSVLYMNNTQVHSQFNQRTLNTEWNFEIAAKLCEKLFEPKFNSVWTNTSIFNGLNCESAMSLSISSGFCRSFSTLIASSVVHFCRMAMTNWWAVAVPGRDAAKIKFKIILVRWTTIAKLRQFWCFHNLSFTHGMRCALSFAEEVAILVILNIWCDYEPHLFDCEMIFLSVTWNNDGRVGYTLFIMLLIKSHRSFGFAILFYE